MASSQVTQPELMRIVFAKGTDVGRKRGHNEDYVDAFSPPDPVKRQQKGELFIVADGMGGHQAGEVASKNAVETISHEYYADPGTDIVGSLTRAVKKANASIHQQAQAAVSQAGMGTTVVAAVIRGEELYLANVGDSRAYLVRNGKIRQVTRDHSFVEEQIRAGILTREEARTHPQRNVITRALGAKPHVEVDIYKGKLVPGDTLLLCTDGLSEYVQDGEMQAILSHHSPQETTSKLITLANERGGNDNITALVVRAAPVTATARLQDTVPVAPQPKDEGRSRLSVPVVAALSAGGLLVVAALVAAAVFFAPLLGGEDATTTPTVMAPEPTPSPSLHPTSTLLPTESAATATLVPSLELLEPQDGAILAPGAEVTFRWELTEILPGSLSFLVKTNRPGYDELCQSDQETCTVALDDEDEYEWWAELLYEGETIRSKRRTLYVSTQATPTGTSMPSFMPSPTIATPPPAEGETGGD